MQSQPVTRGRSIRWRFKESGVVLFIFLLLIRITYSSGREVAVETPVLGDSRIRVLDDPSNRCGYLEEDIIVGKVFVDVQGLAFVDSMEGISVLGQILGSVYQATSSQVCMAGYRQVAGINLDKSSVSPLDGTQQYRIAYDMRVICKGCSEDSYLFSGITGNRSQSRMLKASVSRRRLEKGLQRAKSGHLSRKSTDGRRNQAGVYECRCPPPSVEIVTEGIRLAVKSAEVLNGVSVFAISEQRKEAHNIHALTRSPVQVTTTSALPPIFSNPQAPASRSPSVLPPAFSKSAKAPTQRPSQNPSQRPTELRSQDPTQAPSLVPTPGPTPEQTQQPTQDPTPQITTNPASASMSPTTCSVESPNTQCCEDSDCVQASLGDLCISNTCLNEGNPRFTLTWECEGKLSTLVGKRNNIMVQWNLIEFLLNANVK